MSASKERSRGELRDVNMNDSASTTPPASKNEPPHEGFDDLGLHPHLVQAVADAGYTQPTPIQTAMIPLMLTGRDVIGQAQTGTGKTAAFALPMLHNLDKSKRGIQGLVIAPTRELAMQVASAIHKYGSHAGAKVLAVYGGAPYSRQVKRLRKGIDIVAGTPGRMLDLIRQGGLDISGVSTVVLDEADEMLSMGFIEDIEAILEATPADRQTALFSATLPPEIRRVAGRYMNDPQSCTIKKKQLTVAAIEQRAYLVNEQDKLAALTRIFEMEEIASGLIFVRTRIGTSELANELTSLGFPADALNGEMNQDARTRVLARFRSNRIKVLVATDVAARGLDIDDISHVINFDLPQDPEVYVHRVGRTGRAGKTGIAISLLMPKERWYFGKIERFTKQKVKDCTLPTVEEITRSRETKLVEQIKVWLERGRCRRELEMAAELIEAGHDPLDIAAAALKLARREETQRPIAPIGEVRSHRPRESKPYGRRDNWKQGRSRNSGNRESGMVRLSLSTGRAHGITVNHIVGSLSHHADIPGRAIGKISIGDNHTLVDVPESLAAQVLAKAGNYRIGRNFVSVERA